MGEWGLSDSGARLGLCRAVGVRDPWPESTVPLLQQHSGLCPPRMTSSCPLVPGFGKSFRPRVLY
jgi:hypothetical protein